MRFKISYLAVNIHKSIKFWSRPDNITWSKAVHFKQIMPVQSMIIVNIFQEFGSAIVLGQFLSNEIAFQAFI